MKQLESILEILDNEKKPKEDMNSFMLKILMLVNTKQKEEAKKTSKLLG